MGFDTVSVQRGIESERRTASGFVIVGPLTFGVKKVGQYMSDSRLSLTRGGTLKAI